MKIGELLQRRKDVVIVEDSKEYKSVTIRIKHKGVFLREIKQGNQIGTKRQFKIKKGQFILSRIDARQGAIGIVPDELEGAIVTSDFWAFDINQQTIDIDFFHQLLKSPVFLNACIKASKGTTNRKRIQENFFLNYDLDIPDISLQKKIVKQVNNFYQKYEAIQNQLNYKKWLVDKLRQAILQDAVQGKLVPQDPNDEPAFELLKKIKEEKEKLIKEGIIKKEKSVLTINEDKIPYELPKGWEWVNIGNILKVKSSKRIFEADYTQNGIPFYRSKEIGELAKNGYCKDRYFISYEKYNEIKKWFGIPKEGDLLITSVGSIGSTWLVDKRKFYYKDGNITQIEKCKYIDMSYIKYFISSPFFFKQVNSILSGTAYNALTIIKINSLKLPLPPLNEQKRIVEKIYKLINLCGELEEKIKDSQKSAELLMQAVLQEAFKNNQK